MKIVATQYNLEHRALEIYVSGCINHCPGCHNPELQSFDIGTPYVYGLLSINVKLVDFYDIIDNIWILGGEPLDQNLCHLAELVKAVSIFNKKIWLFTGYPLDEALDRIWGCDIEEYIDYIKYGFYDETELTEENICFGIKLASGNQGIKEL